MADEKIVPHMTDLVMILRDESSLRDLLRIVDGGEFSRDEAAEELRRLPGISLGEKSAKRYVASLCTYSFLRGKKTLSLSDLSSDFLREEGFRYSDYVLSCLSRNLEWAHFLPDMYGLVNESGPLKKAEIVSHLRKLGYDVSGKVKVNRYLGEILPILDIAEVIKYEASTATVGQRSKKEIARFARTNQRELLNMLLMAERRRIPKPTLRRIYQAAVKEHLPLRRWRALARKTQEEIEKIRAIDFAKGEEKLDKDIESKWKLSDDLWRWQSEFLDLWWKTKKGIVKVVTGAGKTHLAMALIEKLKGEYDALHVTIVVPTIVLLEQWYENLVGKLQISPEEIGLRGGGYRDSFAGKNVLIVVINSAIKDDFIGVETANIMHNLLIVDECHRAGAKEFRRIFNTRRDWELGLSATPEREMDDAFEEVLVKELGPIVQTYTYNDALDDGIIPKFDIYNYAVILSNAEKSKYLKLTKDIRRIVDRLKYRYPQLNSPKVKMEAVLRSLQKRHPEDRDLFLYFQKTKERKNDILYPAANRKKFVGSILNTILDKNEGEISVPDSPALESASPDDRVIVFHELIDEINSLYAELDSTFVSIYHSGLPNSLNRIGLALYQSGQTRVLLSVRALIEGVDVPMTNLGIIMASSASQTQRVQSLGRVLRKAPGKDKTKLYIVYVRNTTDERIYRKTDWDRIMGKGNIEFRMWTEFGEVPIEEPVAYLAEALRKPASIDESKLEGGAEYPGRYEGETLGFDSRGRLFKAVGATRTYLERSGDDLWLVFRKHKPAGGRLRVNESGHVLTKVSGKGKLRTLYLGSVKDFPEAFAEALNTEG